MLSKIRFLEKMRKKNSRCLEMAISQANIDDQVVAFLHATTHLRPSDEVLGVEYGEAKDGLVPLKVYLRKEVKKRSEEGKKL